RAAAPAFSSTPAAQLEFAGRNVVSASPSFGDIRGHCAGHTHGHPIGNFRKTENAPRFPWPIGRFGINFHVGTRRPENDGIRNGGRESKYLAERTRLRDSAPARARRPFTLAGAGRRGASRGGCAAGAPVEAAERSCAGGL